MFKPLLKGFLGALILLGVYFSILTLVSGWSFTVNQFSEFWYFIVTLAVGFGIQIGLYSYLKEALHQRNSSRKVLAVTGSTSTAAMISCCAHYLVNLVPILGITGLVTFVAQYQVKLFWLGIIFNLFGIIFMVSRIIKFRESTRIPI